MLLHVLTDTAKPFRKSFICSQRR